MWMWIIPVVLLYVWIGRLTRKYLIRRKAPALADIVWSLWPAYWLIALPIMIWDWLETGIWF
jgi:hypothetical protein